MFEIEEDLDIDEDFLGDVLIDEIEKSCSSGVSKPKAPALPSQQSNTTICRNNTQNLNNSVDGQDEKTSAFLKAWTSNNLNSTQRSLGSHFSKNPPDNSAQGSSFEESPRTFNKQVRTRKFPGPAGLLPERQGNTSLIATEEFLTELESDTSKNAIFQEEELLSQGSSNAFETGAWGALVEQLGSRGRELISTINVKSVRARAKHSRGTKVPFLAVLMQSLDAVTPDPCLLLRDATGEMHGTLHRDVWEKFSEELVPGCVLVLRSVGVISAGVSSRRHYLNITANNIGSIYTTHSGGDIKVINIRPVLSGDIRHLLDEWSTPPPPPPVLQSPAPIPSRLFGSVSPMGVRAPPRLPCRTPFVRPPSSGRNTSMQHTGFRARIPHPPRPSARPPVARPLRPLNGGANVFGRSPPGAVVQQPVKRPRVEPVSQSSAADLSIVESLLDGIDTDSLFGDF